MMTVMRMSIHETNTENENAICLTEAPWLVDIISYNEFYDCGVGGGLSHCWEHELSLNVTIAFNSWEVVCSCGDSCKIDIKNL